MLGSKKESEYLKKKIHRKRLNENSRRRIPAPIFSTVFFRLGFHYLGPEFTVFSLSIFQDMCFRFPKHLVDIAFVWSLS